MDAWIFLVFFAWNSVASFVFAAAVYSDVKVTQAIGCAVFWPLVAIAGIIFVTYDLFIKSGKRLRADIKNRGLLREFDEWLKDRPSPPPKGEK